MQGSPQCFTMRWSSQSSPDGDGDKFCLALSHSGMILPIARCEIYLCLVKKVVKKVVKKEMKKEEYIRSSAHRMILPWGNVKIPTTMVVEVESPNTNNCGFVYLTELPILGVNG